MNQHFDIWLVNHKFIITVIKYCAFIFQLTPHASDKPLRKKSAHWSKWRPAVRQTMHDDPPSHNRKKPRETAKVVHKAIKKGRLCRSKWVRTSSPNPNTFLTHTDSSRTKSGNFTDFPPRPQKHIANRNKSQDYFPVNTLKPNASKCSMHTYIYN